MTEKKPLPHEQPAWQDITLDQIQAMIDGDELDKALFAARTRREGIVGAMDDIDTVLNHEQPSEDLDIDPVEWREAKQALREEFDDLERIIATLQHDLGV